MIIRECPFCQMFQDIQSEILDIEPLNPVVKGHRIIIPRAHVEDFSENPSVSATLMEYAAKCAKKMDAVNLITSKGKPAAQSVFHLHIHLIPRVFGDGLKLPWTGQVKRTSLR